MSIRRPMSSLARPDGLYRYVFIAMSKAGWTLRKEFTMQRQTTVDLNGGLQPDNGEPMEPGTEELPVVECYAHPFSVATFAEWMLARLRATSLSGQYDALAYVIIANWQRPSNNYAPQWFIDEPSYDCDDSTLSATAAAGYDESSSDADACTVREPAGVPRDPLINDDDGNGYDNERKKVCHWFTQYDPKAKPPHDASRSPVRVRRSRRLQEKMDLTLPTSPLGENEPPLSPVRRGPLRLRDPFQCPPAWARRNERFPTHRFTSNDWAYFCYSVALATSIKPTPPPRTRSNFGSRAA
ncbi:hypothetical protein GGF50DRAFT_117870 [Schizophyllum commune]